MPDETRPKATASGPVTPSVRRLTVSRRQVLRIAAIAPVLAPAAGLLAGCTDAPSRISRDTAAFLRFHDENLADPYVGPGVLRNHWYPKDVAEVRDVVAGAAARGGRSRAAGSGWSLSAAVCDPDWDQDLIETHALNSVRRDVLPQAMTPDLTDRLASMEYRSGAEPDECCAFVHVGAGMRIFELYSWLDATTPDLGPTPGGREWAMPTLGGAGGQTVVGAMSTSTHGGDQHLPPIPDAVVAVELVGAGGHLYWIQGTQIGEDLTMALCDENAVVRALTGPQLDAEDLTVITDDDALNAARTGVGRLGVITSVVLRVMPQYGLARTRTRLAWDEVRAQLADPTSELFTSRYLRVMVNPYPSFGSETHRAWIEQRNLVAVPGVGGEANGWNGRKLRAGTKAGVAGAASGAKGDFLATICSHENVSDALNEIADAAEDGARTARGGGLLIAAVFAPLLPPNVTVAGIIASDVLAAGLTAVEVEARRLAQAPTGSIGDLLADFANWLVDNGHGWAVAVLIDAVINSGQPELPQPDVDYSYAVMDMFDYADHACVTDGDSIEIAFDADSDEYLRFVESNIFTAAGDALAARQAVGVYVTLRFTAATAAHLGIERWPRTCVIEVAGLKRFAGIDPFLRRLQGEAIKAGATVHWGQRNDVLAQADVERAYPSLAVWRAQLAQLGEHGPGGQFSTAWTRAVGLEPGT